jgi:MATE family multidrug resistance protein
LNNTRFNHRQVWQLALPMIIANISTPLLGLVDTAVMGHLDNASFLAAVALAGLIFNFLFWGFGFLRMGTAGLSAQAFGGKYLKEILTASIIARSNMAFNSNVLFAPKA